jgi:hypothetical protein
VAFPQTLKSEFCTVNSNLLCASALALVALAGQASSQCSSLTTLVAPNNGLSGNAQVLFDMQVLNASGVTIDSIEIVPSSGAGVSFTVDFYTCATTYVGNDTNSAVWTFRGTGQGISNGSTVLASVDLSDFTLPQGSYGIALNATTGGFRYTNGTGSNEFYSNADMALTLGMAHSTWWGGSTFTPRVWNGAIHYNCSSTTPTNYCTAGTSTNGCAATLSATAQPSASLSTSCVITAANVEGVKAGLLFYGIDNTGFTPLPWSTTSTSFFCVKAPTQRSFQQNSGGTAGLCDGQLVLDWNVFQNAFPGALGTPFSAGDKVYVQAWYRDPPAPRTTNLSDALELTMTP